MIAINQFFDCDGTLHRVLQGSQRAGFAWCINIRNDKAWPEEWPLERIKTLPVVKVPIAARSDKSEDDEKAKEQRWEIFARLLADTPFADLVQPTQRKDAIRSLVSLLKVEADAAKKLGFEKATCSEPTLYKWLRRYWQRGQTAAALFSDYGAATGGDRSQESSFTAGRGRPSPRGIPTYQIGPEDEDNMRWAIDTIRAPNGQKKSLKSTLNDLHQKHYSRVDGNGVSHIKKPGELPSYAQFRAFYEREYDHAARKRHKVGPKDFDKDYRAQWGTVLEDTKGPAERYELDATTMQITVVTNTRKKHHIGKPTLYLIIDRWSRLIVAYFMSFEKPSWMAAAMAIMNISEDKEEMCLKYDVEYNASDWPAHEVFSQEFWVDRGSEWTGKKSMQIVRDLGTTLNLLPPARPELKPFVENAHKQVMLKLQEHEPSSDPTANQRSRQATKYTKEAASTMHRLHKYVIEAIISINREIATNYPRSQEMIADELEASPINLWNYGVEHHTGLAPRIEYEDVKLALLPRERGAVNEDGLKLKDCYFLSNEMKRWKWLEEGRRNTFYVDVSYDPRSNASVYVHPRATGRGKIIHVAYLSPKSKILEGLSFAEVAHFDAKDRIASLDGKDRNREEASRHAGIVKPLIEHDQQALKAATKGDSMASRTKHSKRLSQEARDEERQSTPLVTELSDRPASRSTAMGTPALTIVPTAPTHTRATPAASRPAAPGSADARLAALREKYGSPRQPAPATKPAASEEE